MTYSTVMPGALAQHFFQAWLILVLSCTTLWLERKLDFG